MESGSMKILSRALDGALPGKTFKRSYKKSTTGCATCKARKVKCDEARPACGNCNKRYVNPRQHCQYGPASRNRQLGKPSKAPKSITPVDGQEAPLHQTIPWQPLGLTDSSQRTLELRLMHEYTKSTTDMWSLGAMSPILGYEMWKVDIPQIAFSSDLVLNAVLAISALRLRGVTPDDAILARASLFYLDRAVTKHQEALGCVDQRTAEQLLVAAVLIAHHTWLSAHSKNPDERFMIDLRTYHMCNGIKALIQQFRPWLDKYEPSKRDFKISGPKSPDKSMFMLRATQDLESLSTAFDRQPMPQGRKEIYESAAKVLIDVYALIASGADIVAIEQTVITYLHRVPAEFAHLLKEEDPIAMAMHARAVGMLTQAEGSPAWWIHGVGEHKVPIKCVLGIQALMPPEWQWTMIEPVRIVQRDIDP